jgi:hypothetical protein
LGTVLTLVVSAYFFIISYRLQFAFFLFIFLIPFLPKYIGFGVGSEGFALSLKRILFMIIFMWTAVSFTQNREYISGRIMLVYQYNKMLVNLLLLLFLLKIFSLSINSRELSQYVSLIDDFLASIFIFILTILVIDSKKTIHRLMKTIFYGYTIVLILVAVESIVKFPILSIFASGQIQSARDVSEVFSRDGSYRAIGSFINPIVLGTYLVVLLPIIISYISRNKYSLTFKIIYLIFIMYAIYTTGSRSPILITLVMIYLYIILQLYRGNQLTRFIITIFNLILISIIVYFVVNYISDLIINFSGRFDLISNLEERSSTSRALQYIKIYDIMHEAPFFGFGRMRNFTVLLQFTIDNYYFWLILELGIIGLTIYFFFLFTLVKTAWHQYRLPNQNYYLLSLTISIILMIFYQMLNAAKDIHIYLYIFTGLISVMKVLQNNEIKVHDNILDTTNMNKRNNSDKN